MSFSIDLSDQIGIVTGVTSGIGAGVADVLAQAGADVAGCGRSAVESDGAKAFFESVNAQGRRAEYCSIDLRNVDGPGELVERTIAQFGRIDFVISNAGFNVFRGAAECTEEDWQMNLDLNLASHWRLARAVHPHLEQSASGAFVVMTSNHAYSCIPGCFPYDVTKTALLGLVRTLAVDWGPGVRVVGIAPGFIETRGADKWFGSFPDPEIERQRTIDRHPAGKLGTPEEVGAFCAFLVSRYAGFATGTTYLLDGGRSALMQDD